MKYFKTLKIYKNSSGTNEVDLENMTASSYGHWLYMKEVDGVLFFNNSRYSVSTSKHQADCRTLLRENNITPDVILKRTTISLISVENAITSEISEIEKEVIELKTLIEKKGTRKEKNIERKNEVLNLKTELKQLNKILKGMEK